MIERHLLAALTSLPKTQSLRFRKDPIRAHFTQNQVGLRQALSASSWERSRYRLIDRPAGVDPGTR